jgi:ferrous iron transport protein A
MPLNSSMLRGMSQKLLTELKKGDKAVVVGIDAGVSSIKRFCALGISQGKIIKKVSSLKFGGPIILLIDRANVAIGKSMAKKIIVRKIDDDGC